LLIDKVGNELSGRETDLFIIAPEAFLEVEDETSQQQLTIVWELETQQITSLLTKTFFLTLRFYLH
jgi:hypothetical protein